MDLSNNERENAWAELERGVQAALETYSNVHRGSGHNSMVSTFLFEKAREIILEHFGLNKARYVVIFCTPRRAAILTAQLEPGSYQILSSLDIGLSLGLRAVAVQQKALPKGIPFQSGGGTTRLIAPGWVIWAGAPDKFEAGTPVIINCIAFAKALQLIRKSGKEIFRDSATGKLSASEILYHDDLDKYSGKELLDELRLTLIGRGIRVPTLEGSKPFINLDNAASTPTFTPVWDAVRQTWRQAKQVQQEVIKEVRSICTGVTGAPLATHDVIFTSNTTEAINLVAESLGRSGDDTEPVVLNTILEHSSNDLPWRNVPRHSLIRMPADDEGFIDLKELESLLRAYNQEERFGRKRIRLIAISGASNVLGVCNDLAAISRTVHLYGAHLLVDAAQLVAHRKVEMERCGIDYLAFSAHKCYAPFGSGALVVKKGLLNFKSAEMEMIHSSGEENAGGIAALGKALLILQRIGMDVIREEEQELTRWTLSHLAQVPGLRIFGIKDPGSPAFARKGGVIVFTLKGRIAPTLANELALRGGIGVRCGCHCAHLLVKRLLHVGPRLQRFQHMLLSLFPKISLPGILRVSLGIENTREDVVTLIRVLGEIAGKPPTSTGHTASSDIPGPPLVPKRAVKKEMKEFVRASALRVYS